MWTNVIKVTIIYNTNHLIHCRLTQKETRRDWLLTCNLYMVLPTGKTKVALGIDFQLLLTRLRRLGLY